MMSQSNELPTVDEILIKFGRYAYPVLGTFFKALNIPPSSRVERETRLVDVSEAIGIHMAFLAISKLREDKYLNDNFVDSMKRIGDRPSFGIYTKLLRETLQFYEGINNDFFYAFFDFYSESVSPEIFRQMKRLSDSLLKAQLTKKNDSYKDLVDLLVTHRNAFKHPELLNQKISAENRIDALQRVLYALLERISMLMELPICDILEVKESTEGIVHEVRIWNGQQPQRRQLTFDERLIPGSVYALWNLDCTSISPDENSKRTEQSGYHYFELLPFYAALDNDEKGEHELYTLKLVKKSRFDYSSPVSQNACSINPKEAKYARFAETWGTINTTKGVEGLPEHLRAKFLEVDKSSEQILKSALAVEHTEDAIDLLKQALKKSPGYREGIRELARFYERVNDDQAAHDLYSSFLQKIPDESEFLLADAELLIKTGRLEEAEERLMNILAEEEHHEEANKLKLQLSHASGIVLEEGQKKTDLQLSLLPYELLLHSVKGSIDHIRLYLILFVSISTVLLATSFFLYHDPIMGLTSVSLGITWSGTLWATFRIRKLLVSSSRNFQAFLKARRDEDFRLVFREIVPPVFGRHDNLKEGFGGYLQYLVQNWKRMSIIVLTIIFGLIFFHKVSNFQVVPLWVEFVYYGYLFFFIFSLAYLLTNIVSFQMLLRELRFRRIHFSLVQHPKMSIRYLSLLSRRISFPVLIIYILFTFTMYLGPFRSNLGFIGVLSLFVIASAFIYFSSVIQVRNVIVENKWRLISIFSSHFDAPFAELIEEAKASSLKRLEDLIKMRDFIDSMDVWAERKSTLITNSLIYFAVIAFATIGLSNLMTRSIVPLAYSKLSQTRNIAYENTETVSTNPSISLSVEGVDDTFLLFYAPNDEELLATVEFFLDQDSTLRNYGIKRDEFSGFERCDWANGVHGSIDHGIPFYEGEGTILLFGYNKVFTNTVLPILGGGKYSHELFLRADGKTLYNHNRFIRFNTQEIGYLARITLKQDGSHLNSNVWEDKAVLEDESSAKLVEIIEARLKLEPDMEVDVLKDKPESL
ncbi:tetratricopeptide repeat protein [bacterium]|nr:tetratricopeptide repeat protein [bacterium]